MNRREFLKATALSTSMLLISGCLQSAQRKASKKPNIVFVFGDQWRAKATGYAGDPNAKTPVLDALEKQSINFTNAVSGCPVCSPYRASLITGQYPLTHGVFLNDVHLADDAVSIAKVYKQAGYDTGYIGKWHIDGNGRSAFIPRKRRQGFDFWKVLECTHGYNSSFYYGDEDKKLKWEGYDSIAQTKEANMYIREHAGGEKPFMLFVSWGPPHAPYHTAPEKYKNRFNPNDVVLHPNVPDDLIKTAKKDMAGYYAHIAALDDCIKDVMDTLEEAGIADNTILVFTSDHGDMLYSHGMRKKQKPYEESARVPFLLRYPGAHGDKGRRIDMPINTPDIMPTLLGLCGLKIPDTVEGTDYSGVIRGREKAINDAALLTCPSPFGQWERRHGGKEYRGIRTRRYTYTRDLDGPWLLYDNQKDPYQQNNICNKAEYADVQKKLDGILKRKLKERNDKFLPGAEYIKKWGWTVNENGTVPYRLKRKG